MKKLTSTDKCICFEYVLLAGIILSTVLNRESIGSIFFLATFALLIVSICCQLKHISLNLVHFLAICCIFISFIHVLLTSEIVSLAYFKKLIIFSCTILFFLIIYRLDVSDKLYSAVLLINIFISLIYPVCYLFINSGVPDSTGSLSFNFTNANLAGIYLLHSCLYSVLACLRWKNLFVKLIMSSLCIFNAYLTSMTYARSCILAILFFTLLIVLYHSFRKFKSTFRLFSFFLIISPLIIAIVYIALCHLDIINEFNFLEINDGKTVESRETIWNYAFENYFNSPVIGSYGYIGGVSGASQLHNIHIDVLVSYGTLPFILFVLVLNLCTDKVVTYVQSFKNYAALCAFYAVIFTGAFEAALVSGGLGIYILSGGFLILAKCKQ